MTKAYSNDLRIRVAKAVLEDHELSRDVAKRFQVSHSSAKRWVKKQAQEGDVNPKQTKRGRKPKLRAEDIEEIRAYVEKRPDATYPEILRYFQEKTQKHVCKTTIVRAVLDLNLRRKKTLHRKPTG